MKEFKIVEDLKVETWKRFYHIVQAETLEDAVLKVLEEESECYDSEYLDETDHFLSPEENWDQATQEVFYNNKKVYTNVEDYV